jgi:serine/threonine protein kinase/Flp pilus assembly protein TadD
MKMEPKRTCPSCGNELSGAMEFCPVCMLRKGLAGGVKSGESSASEDTVKPRTPEEALQRFEHYELVTGEDGKPVELGRGAMGITYKAFDVDLRCLVTLKVITGRYLNDESARLRFLREARAAASVRHPNVASVFHLGRTGENYFYAMEFVEGETLESLIQRSDRLEVKLALEISAQVAAGLAAVHEQKLVHRDIKPTNIMVSLKDTNRVKAKIIDLGLSKTVAESPSQPAISMPGAFAGTPEFASPEQFAGVGVDIRSDLYSFGVTLWQMLTGKLPFHGTPAEIMYQHQHAPVPLEQLINVPQPIVALLQLLLEKDPKWRFQSPTELLNALAKVTAALTTKRSVTHRYLRTVTDEQLGMGSKTTSAFSRLITTIGSPNARRVLWAPLALLVAGGLITIIGTFLTARHRISDPSTTTLSATKTPEKSIAVLPFESLSDDKSDTYFADGVQDEILSNLAKVSQLKVISRTSVMTYRSTNNRNLRSIANALGVANVVEGTVRRDGNQVRVTTELIDARTDQTLWSDSYDRNLTDIFAIQSDIAQTIASKLRARLSPEEKQGMQEKPTQNLDAYDLYLQAQELINGAQIFAIGDLRKNLLNAVQLLEEATRKDPNFALAYCSIASAQDELYVHRNDDDEKPERRAAGDAAISEALRLQPNLAEAHLRLASHLYMVYRDYERARVQLAIAERDLHNSPEALSLKGALDRRQGRWEESTKGLEKAVDLDPRNPMLLHTLGDNYFFLRRFRESVGICDRLIELEPDKPIFKFYKATKLFAETAELKNYRAALDALWPLSEGDWDITYSRLCAAIYDRDWTAAKEILNSPGSEYFPFPEGGALVPRACIDLWIARLQGDHPKMEGSFATARDQLNQKVEGNLEDASLLSALGLIDAALGRKKEAITEARHAAEMLPVSKDARDGPALVCNLAAVYALTNEPEHAFQEIAVSIKTPGGIYYADLKLDPTFDPLHGNPTFDNLLAQLAPHD